MIFSSNPKPTPEEFDNLMKRTDFILNKDALARPDYYVSRGGHPLEDDVKNALEESAKGTSFDGSIEKISGQRFPDIVAAGCYGIEVKSTKTNHWTSTGSSILETTRLENVDRIYLTFGKLGGKPIQFMSRPYEECLCGIAVTHMPRYLIDMTLSHGETIFDKMGVSYETLRKMDKPTVPVAKYYKSKLKPGESLWWTGNDTDEAVSATVRLWKNLTPEEKQSYTIYGCVNFPEVFRSDYDRYSLWLTSQGIVDPHIRDQFSSGGKETMLLSSGETRSFPGIYRRIKKHQDLIIQRVAQKDSLVFEFQDDEITNDKHLRNHRLNRWIEAVSKMSTMGYELSKDALKTLFKVD